MLWVEFGSKCPSFRQNKHFETFFSKVAQGLGKNENAEIACARLSEWNVVIRFNWVCFSSSEHFQNCLHCSKLSSLLLPYLLSASAGVFVLFCFISCWVLGWVFLFFFFFFFFLFFLGFFFWGGGGGGGGRVAVA